MKKLVLTGAAGRLGSYLREPLSKMADTLVSTDIVDDIGKLYDGEVQTLLARITFGKPPFEMAYDVLYTLVRFMP